jgi:acyl-CoA dehydrogenase
MATEVDIGRTYLNTLLAAEYIRGDDITTRVSMAKAWLREMVNRVAYQVVQLQGGYGTMEEYRFSYRKRPGSEDLIFFGLGHSDGFLIHRTFPPIGHYGRYSLNEFKRYPIYYQRSQPVM